MSGEKNRSVLAFSTLLAVGLLLGALFVLWLLPASGGRVGSAAPVSAPEGAPIDEQSRINVRGTGIVSARPDTLYAQVGVQADNPSLADAQWDAGQKIDSMLDVLKAAGVADNDIATSRYSVDSLME